MTTHVFIVDETSFRCHLKYLFVGTGAKEKDVDFNNNSTSSLYSGKKYAAEASLVAMMADCCRVRADDYIIFYLQATPSQEGRFYGVFRAIGDAFLDRNNGSQYLKAQLGKNLTFRVRIKAYQVYEKGVTEWAALDEIHHIPCPSQMLWSLIYRKLKGNRGNTMITIYESERLIDLIRRENNNVSLCPSGSYDYQNGKIVLSPCSYPYLGAQDPINILPRLIYKCLNKLSYETHLQMYITQSIGRNSNLDNALGILHKPIEWIGNEVSCGVGMQRIDVMLSVVEDETQRLILPIELKAVPASKDNIPQLSRYVEWVEQYYIPNRTSTIQPVLICPKSVLPTSLKKTFHSFNSSGTGRFLPLKYIEYSVSGGSIVFSLTAY